MNDKEMMSLSIRELTEDDIEQVKKLDDLSIRKYNDVLSGEVSNKLRKIDSEAICRELISIYGVFDSEELVGYCTLDGYGQNGNLGSVLSNVLISPNYQNKHIGMKLVEHVLKKAPRPVYICCLGKQFRFYEKFGFKRIDKHPMELMILE